MADGIRIQPQAARFPDISLAAGALIIVRDLSRPIPRHPNNAKCHICGLKHKCKTYHFRLDADGTVMVSTTIWNKLQLLYDNGGFEKVNVVSTPPTQYIHLPSG